MRIFGQHGRQALLLRGYPACTVASLQI